MLGGAFFPDTVYSPPIRGSYFAHQSLVYIARPNRNRMRLSRLFLPGPGSAVSAMPHAVVVLL